MKILTQRGFTLIELLVVIAIIGMLASVVLASLSSARSKARFARVLSDFNSIMTAAYLDSDDRNGGWAPDVGSGATPAFVPTYLPTWPKPPCGSYNYDWERWSGGNDIRISLRGPSGVVFQKCIYQKSANCTDISTVSDKNLSC